MMGQQFYNYERRSGVLPVSWSDFVGICKGLALAVETFQPEMILGIIRGGLYPATQLSHLLRVDVHPIRVTRRQNDRVVYEEPRWLIQPPEEVKNRRVLIVDEICSEGKTLRVAVEGVRALGAASIRTAVMYAHTSGQGVPDYIGLVTDELILNPWDREILNDGTFALHPEIAHALSSQGLEADPSLLLGISPRPLAKP